MIGCHQGQRLRTDQPDAAEFAAVEQRPAEREIIGRGRTQSATSGYERWRREERALGRVVLQRQAALAVGGVKCHAALRVGRVAGRETMGLAGRYKEVGVAHIKRIENTFL